MASRYVSVAGVIGLLIGAGAAADEPQPDPKLPPIRRMLAGDDAKKAADLKRQFAKLASASNWGEAIKVAEELLALRVRVQGKDHWQVREDQQLIADLRRPLTAEQDRQLAEAERLDQRVATFFQNGKARDAIPVAEKSLALVTQVYGDDHPETARCRNDLGALQHALSDYAAAETHFEAALRIRRKTLGDTHPATATSRNNLGRLYHDQGKWADAEPLLKEALVGFRGALGDEHPDTASGMNSLGGLYRTQGKLAAAEALFKEALQVRRVALGDNHPATAISLNSLAGLYQDLGQFAAAEELYKETLRVRRAAQGNGHPATAIGLKNLASLYLAEGKLVSAEPLFKEALRIDRAAFGDEHLSTAGSVNSLAVLYREQGKFVDAELLFKDALRVRRALKDDLAVANTLNDLAALYRADHSFAAAKPLFKEAIDIRRRKLGDGHPDTARSRNSLGVLHSAASELDAAEPLLKEALAGFRGALGDEHPDTARGVNNLAHLYRDQGKLAEAEQHFKEALRVLRKVHGGLHPHTVQCLTSLGVLYRAQGRLADAQSCLLQATAAYEATRLTSANGVDRALIGARLSPYSLQAVGAARGAPREAFAALEADLARGLLDEQASRRPPTLTATETALRDRLVTQLLRLQPRVLFLTTRPAPTDGERKELDALARERTDLQAKLSELAVTVSRREVADLAAVQKALPPGAAYVAWVDDKSGGAEEHWVCVVRSTGDPRWERLPGTGAGGKWGAADDDLPQRLRSAITGDKTNRPSPPADVAELAKRLRAQRLAPAVKHLDGVKVLYAVATGPMAGVPVEVVAPEYTVSYAPSATFLARLVDRAKPTATAALVLGDPIFTAPGAKPGEEKPVPPGGLLISIVAAEGAAAKANLRPGDVLLKYGSVELTDIKSLEAALATGAGQKTVPVVVWRASTEKPFTRDVAPGRLGVVVAPDPAPVAVANRYRLDAALARSAWQDLPGTRAEIERLRELLDGRATVLAGAAASKQRLNTLRESGELAKCRYLHFATHGAGNAMRAMEAYLVLAQSNRPGEPEADGLLTAREVLDGWKLDAELVTLSACETALGRPGGGDGLLGFSQAFLAAGSRSVCLSLWKVDDLATVLLMDRFYQNLLGQRKERTAPLGKAAALAEAKAWLRDLSSEEALKRAAAVTNGVARGPGEKPLKLDPPNPADAGARGKPFAHPRYWAAFVLVGDPN